MTQYPQDPQQPGPQPPYQGQPPQVWQPPAPPPLADAEVRRMSLGGAIAREVSFGGRVESQSEYQAVIVHGKRPNHILHLILTLITFGLWALVWLLLTILQKERRMVLTVDPYGQVFQS